MYDLTRFSLHDMTRCGMDLRRLAGGAGNMEEVGQRLCRYFYDRIVHGPHRERACRLVRFYKTHPLADLDDELRRFAESMAADAPLPAATKCLTLLATVGDEPEWNSRHASNGHRAIPLPSPSIVGRFPMIAQLVKQFGLDIKALVRPDPALIVDMDHKTYNVFHVGDARGSPYIPAQADFVFRYGIRSALGFGGMLPSANLFAVIMFTKVPIPRETADFFETLALSAKMAVLPFDGGPTFASSAERLDTGAT